MVSSILEKNFLTISHLEFWEKFNYYGIQAILILLLTKKLGLSDNDSFVTYSIYTALSFGFSIIGGLIADKLLGPFYTTLFGCILLFIGNIILMFIPVKFIFLGLSFVLIGFGLIKPNTPNLIGSIYKKESHSIRDKAFSIFYLFLNIGSISGPLFYGFFFHLYSYWSVYLFSAAGILSGIFFFLLNRKVLISENITAKKLKLSLAIVIIFFCIITSYLLLADNRFSPWFFSFSLVFFIFFLYKFLKKVPSKEKLSLTKLIFPVLACIVFFAALLQIYSSITLFVDRNIDKNIFGWQIPTAWFSALEPILLLFFAPFLNSTWSSLTKKGKEINSFYKIIIGLVIASIAFLTFSLAADLNNSNQMMLFALLFLGYGLLAISELSIIPITISLVNFLSPENYKNTIMGVFYFSLTLSGYLSSLIIKNSVPSIASPIKSFSPSFLFIAGLLFVTTAFLAVLNRVVHNLHKEPAVTKELISS